MLEEKDVFQFAERVAKSYCARVNNYRNIDDAVSEACVFLLEHRDQWNRPPQWLYRRAVGQLIRNFQNEHGLRRKNRAFYTENYDLQTHAETVEVDAPKRTDARIRIIERALKQPDFVEYAEVVRDIVAGMARTDIALKHNITQGRISQIFNRFKTVCQRLDEEREPTHEDKTKYPLLFGDENE